MDINIQLTYVIGTCSMSPKLQTWTVGYCTDYSIYSQYCSGKIGVKYIMCEHSCAHNANILKSGKLAVKTAYFHLVPFIAVPPLKPNSGGQPNKHTTRPFE